MLSELHLTNKASHYVQRVRPTLTSPTFDYQTTAVQSDSHGLLPDISSHSLKTNSNNRASFNAKSRRYQVWNSKEHINPSSSLLHQNDF